MTSIPALNGGSAALSILRAMNGSRAQDGQTGVVPSQSNGNVPAQVSDLRDTTMMAMGEINRILMENGGQLIHAGAFSTVRGTEYGDYIETGPGSSVRGGAGNDTIYAQHHSTVNGGAGNDTIEVGGYSNAYGGEGDDYISGGGTEAVLSGGGGNDRIIGGRGTKVVEGGAGEDSLWGVGVELMDGGAGEDYLSAAPGTQTVDGGEGNDVISLTNHMGQAEDTVIRYDAGDGSDKIRVVNSHARLEFGEGISADDVTIGRTGNTATVSFAGSDDELTVRMGEYGGFEGTGLTLSFPDGSTREIGGDINPSKVVAMYSPETGFVRFDQD